MAFSKLRGPRRPLDNSSLVGLMAVGWVEARRQLYRAAKEVGDTMNRRKSLVDILW